MPSSPRSLVFGHPQRFLTSLVQLLEVLTVAASIGVSLPHQSAENLLHLVGGPRRGQPQEHPAFWYMLMPPLLTRGGIEEIPHCPCPSPSLSLQFNPVQDEGLLFGKVPPIAVLELLRSSVTWLPVHEHPRLRPLDDAMSGR